MSAGELPDITALPAELRTLMNESIKAAFCAIRDSKGGPHYGPRELLVILATLCAAAVSTHAQARATVEGIDLRTAFQVEIGLLQGATQKALDRAFEIASRASPN